jgi:hypothetical protein
MCNLMTVLPTVQEPDGLVQSTPCLHTALKMQSFCRMYSIRLLAPGYVSAALRLCCPALCAG